MRTWLAATVMLLGGIGAHAQATMTVSPLKTECGRKCSGMFSLLDDSNLPAVFTVDAYAVKFSESAQGPIMSHLDEKAVNLWISNTSGRLSPHESKAINFKYECPEGDCQIFFASTVGVINHGANQEHIRAVLPHMSYACSNGAHDCRKRTLAAAGVVPPENRK